LLDFQTDISETVSVRNKAARIAIGKEAGIVTSLMEYVRHSVASFLMALFIDKYGRPRLSWTAKLSLKWLLSLHYVLQVKHEFRLLRKNRPDALCGLLLSFK
jgi:hypothetical protein